MTPSLIKKTTTLLLLVLGPVCLSAQTNSVPADLAERINKVETGLTGGIVVEGDPTWSIKQRMELYNIPAVTIAVVKRLQDRLGKSVRLCRY